MLVHGFLSEIARATPDQACIVVGDVAHSFAAIERDSDRLACAFRQAGVKRGDRVVAVLENSAAMVVSLWAALKAGAIFVPLYHTVKDDKLAFILGDTNARCVVAPSERHDRILASIAEARCACTVFWAGSGEVGSGRPLREIFDRTHARPADPGLIDQDLALIIYTSGSTGKPKGVMMSHATVRNNASTIAAYLGNRPDDVVLSALPLSYSYGLFQVLTAARVGFPVVLERSFAYPYELLRRAAAHRVTGLPGVPTFFATLLQFAPFNGIDLSALRYLTNAAGPLPPAHVRRLRALLPQARLFSMYGLTECTRVSYLDPHLLDAKVTSVGRAMPNSEAYVVDESGRRVAPGEVGELVVRGANLMTGYWRRPIDTARALRDGEVAGEKVLYTGDLFRADADGDLYFVGRKDDVFKCRGEKVSPREIENVLYEIDGVAEAAVIGVPDASDGTAIKAFVAPRPDCTVDEKTIRAHCRHRLQPTLLPKFVEVRATLPKTESGKIAKGGLRAAASAEPPPDQRRSRDNVIEELALSPLAWGVSR